MSQLIKPFSFVDKITQAKINLVDSAYAVALSNTLPSLKDVSTIDQVTQIAELGGYKAGGEPVVNVRNFGTDGVFILSGDAVEFKATGGDFPPFRYLVLYQVETGNVIGWYDYDNQVTLTDGNFFRLDVISSGFLRVA